MDPMTTPLPLPLPNLHLDCPPLPPTTVQQADPRTGRRTRIWYRRESNRDSVVGKGAAFARVFCASVFVVITIALALNAHFLIANDGGHIGDRGVGEDVTNVGNDTTAADWMSDNGEVVIAIIGRSKKETETLFNGIDLRDCDLKCRYVEWDKEAKMTSAVAFLGNVKPPSGLRHISRVPWVHLALDPENLGAADGVDFDLTVSYHPGADIDMATVVFRRAENSTGPRGHQVAADDDEDANEGDQDLFGASDALPTGVQGRREVAIIMDQCKSASNREGYVAALREHISVHVYGDCGAPCPFNDNKSDCVSHIDRFYPFILVFEPFLCQHYQSDGIWTALQRARNTVPVVFGGVEYSRVLPENSYIDALNQSPKTLARYLRFLEGDERLYNHYLRWRDSLEMSYSRWPCELCRAISSRKKRDFTAPKDVEEKEQFGDVGDAFLDDKEDNGKMRIRRRRKKKQRQMRNRNHRNRNRKTHQKPLCTSWPDLNFQ